MDESIRIYSPKQDLIPNYASAEDSKNEKKPMPRQTPPKLKWECRHDSLMEVLKERELLERKLHYKHPWIPIITNWVIAGLIVALFVSLIVWAIQIRNDHKEASIRQTAYAEFQAEQEQAAAAEAAAKAEAEAALKASEEYVTGEMTVALSKMYYGIKGFQDKYHYTDEDFETYGRCAYNRMLNPAYSNDFIDVVFQEAQFLSCSESNPDVEPYHSMAKKHIQKWRSESVAPVSNDFVYAELTADGVYLKNDFNANGYSRRWRAGT